jgi:aryl-alcohol dehydrogenase-like predicted oxidoreductase
VAAQAVQTCVTDNRTSTQTAVRFVLQHPAVTSAIVGVSKMEQLNDVAGTTNSTNLLEKEINILRESIPVKKYLEHR